jgi:hypothetical protein
VFDVSKHDLCKFLRQNFCPKSSIWHSRVNWMSSEIKFFPFDGISHRHIVDDVLLRPILDSNITESQRDVLTCKHSLCVGTLIHDINFG